MANAPEVIAGFERLAKSNLFTKWQVGWRVLAKAKELMNEKGVV